MCTEPKVVSAFRYDVMVDIYSYIPIPMNLSTLGRGKGWDHRFYTPSIQ